MLDKNSIAKLLANNKNLTALGMDDPRRPGFDESRARMFEPETVNLVNHCIAFLSAFTPAKTATWGAEWLAGHAAAWGLGRAAIQYNGALIAAALHLGLATGPDYRYSLSLGLARKQVEWVCAQSPGVAAVGATQKPRDWDTFLGRRHLFA